MSSEDALPSSPGFATNLAAGAGHAIAVEAMVPQVYDELRRLAAGYLRHERRDHTLQPTALVHEAYLRLLGQRTLDWQNRAHVLAMAAQMMRRILTNHAVARSRLKRGGSDSPRMALDQALDFYDRREISLAAVDEALRDLEKLDARQAQIVELRFFGGLKIEEIAEVLSISPATVKREWLTAKLWLQREMAGDV